MADVYLLHRHFNQKTKHRAAILKHRRDKLEKAMVENRNDPLSKITVEECRERYRFRPDSIKKVEAVLHDDLVR